jgi:SAM-dependent methyltransferase
MSQVLNRGIDQLYPDRTNPRTPDQARMALLALSLQKLGFVMPVYATAEGMLLSGHQRLTVAKARGISMVPTVTVELKPQDIQGINILFNRATNDFNAFDTGAKARERLTYPEVVAAAENLPDFEGEEWYALQSREVAIRSLGRSVTGRYDKKATVLADSILRLGIRIPIVVSRDGRVVNGIHRLFAAKERSLARWPVIEVPNEIADVATNFLNYLSMDFKVGEEFADMLRHSAYRRPQNNRGDVPKAYRFWGNGEKTLPDSESYSRDYWRHFRDIHGNSILDFGAGLGKVAPFLRAKGFDCIDFEPYRIDIEKDKGIPNPVLSKREAKRFLDEIADGRRFTSIFLASVLNSIPFPTDRLAVLAIVHALSSRDTVVYGTCRDVSDFNYEYGGIRNANYFVFDSEPGVRVGDVMRNPKIQKFHTQDEADAMFKRLWNKTDYWPGGNVFYFRVSAPKGLNLNVLKQALALEFNLPYADGTRMGLVDYAKKAFAKRIGVRSL